MSFILKMAWRDTRASRRRLLLFGLSIVLGVAALVSIGSLRDNLQRAIDEQARTLLGADLVIESRAALSPEAREFVASLGGEQSREISFNSMLVVPGRNPGTRLVQVRALAGGFPFYGEFVTDPPGARASLSNGTKAVLEQSVLEQFQLHPGDKIKLGGTLFELAAGLRKVPGENAVFATLAPRVYIPFAAAEGTGLLKQGSLARYRIYVKMPAGVDVEKRVEELRGRFRELRLGVETVESRKRDLGESLRNVNSFLMIVGFASLFLGAIGVASAVQSHIRQKVPTVAVLRCLGASARTSFAIYLAQGIGLTLAGAAAGAALGLAAQLALAPLVRGFLPFAFEPGISWPAALRGMGAGLAAGGIFSLLPLLEVRRVSPLLTLRSGFSNETGARRDPWRGVLLGVMVLFIFVFAVWQTGRWRWGVGFTAALLLCFAVLAGVARLAMWLAKKMARPVLPFVWRQGLGNLHRPQNRTWLLIIALGLGTFLIMTLFFARDTMLRQLEVMDAAGRPNLMLFDIQDDQVAPLEKLLAANSTPALQEAPIVTMRIAALKGRPVADLLREEKNGLPAWTLRREYRSTYRGELSATEKIIAGAFTGRVPAGTERVPVSLEESLARDMRVRIGDEIDFDVQGVPVKATVGSIRKVDWRRMQPNFFVVFPLGVLEDAPKFHLVAVRAATPAQSAQVQQAVVADFPNVSAIDLTLILETLDGVYSQASFVVGFLALFAVGTGAVVLTGTVLTGRQQRVQESVLLRTLGATRAQVNGIMFAEYLVLGTLGAAAGSVMAIGANWALARYVFELGWSAPPWLTLVAGWAAVSILTVATGLFASRGICDHPPLEVLRQET